MHPFLSSGSITSNNSVATSIQLFGKMFFPFGSTFAIVNGSKTDIIYRNSVLCSVTVPTSSNYTIQIVNIYNTSDSGTYLYSNILNISP